MLIVVKKKKILLKFRRILYFYYLGYLKIKNQAYLNFFFSYKFLYMKLNQMPHIIAIKVRGSYRPFITKRKNEKLALGFLLNLYFLVQMRFLKYGLLRKLDFSCKDTFHGWLLNQNNNQLDILALFSFLQQTYCTTFYNQSKFKINSFWTRLNPRGWVKLPTTYWFKMLPPINNTNLIHYLYEERLRQTVHYSISVNSYFQLRLNFCSNSAWFVKLNLLRFLQYPCMFNLKQLTALKLSTEFALVGALPFERFQNDSYIVWQANPKAVKLMQTLNIIRRVVKKGVITEFSIAFFWYKLMSQNALISSLVRQNLLYTNFNLFLKLIKVNWK